MTDTPSSAPPPPTPRRPQRPLRVPSMRASAALAAVALGLGVALGAAIGPAPDTSFAGGPAGLAQRLPALLAGIAARAGAGAATSTTTAPPPPAVQATPASAPPAAAPSTSSAAASTSPASLPTSGSTETTPSTSGPGTSQQTKLAPVTNVWLIQLDGTTVAQAVGQPSAAPYIDAQLIPAGTLLSGWSALQGSALASEASLLASSTPGGPPPLLHSIVQPPCPEGAAGASCAPGTAGQLTAADEFLKATLPAITASAAYREHGLVVVTFASVGLASQAGLPAGTSSATLTSQPPAGVVLLSPFAHAGAHDSTAFDPASPARSLELLLH